MKFFALLTIAACVAGFGQFGGSGKGNNGGGFDNGLGNGGHNNGNGGGHGGGNGGHNNGNGGGHGGGGNGGHNNGGGNSGGGLPIDPVDNGGSLGGSSSLLLKYAALATLLNNQDDYDYDDNRYRVRVPRLRRRALVCPVGEVQVVNSYGVPLICDERKPTGTFTNQCPLMSRCVFGLCCSELV